MHDIQEKWQEIIEFLRVEFDLQKVSFDIWIKPLKVLNVVDNVVYIEVKDEKWVKHMEDRYAFPLEMSMKAIVGGEYIPKFVVEMEENRKESRKKEVKKNPSERLTFDNFVVGSENKVAYTAALEVANEPGELTIHNPLFLYGDAGVGKTHLLRAIENHIKTHHPQLQVCYTTSENFTNDLVSILQSGNSYRQATNMCEFRNKYREIDVLLVDDIQFIIGKASTQEEFFHTFNHLRDNGKQIVISSDKPPREMEEFESRFLSRFSEGLVEKIEKPEYVTRKAILNKMIENEKWEAFQISEEIINYLAMNVTSNIRDLRGALYKLVTHLKLENRSLPMDIEEVKNILQDVVLSDEKKAVTPGYILDAVAEHCGITVAELKGKKRDAKIVVPRQIAMYLIRKTTDYTLEAVGIEVGGKNYATVKHGIEKIEKGINEDIRLKELVNVLEKKIGAE